ncbi:MAG: zinc-binding alcohol dehydrogenase family protein [Candidatus Aminicenantes bacterium]|nr:zinc-binding alcohol dehydrogenase family protein [Candidatus Aminicenantes bacterium]
MKAIQLKSFDLIEENPLEYVDIEVPEPGEGEILVRVKICGVCHTDLHTVEGELPKAKLPVIPGHQIVGVVEKRGKGAERFQIGERVGAAWLYSACGKCVYCRRDKENLCKSAQFTGYDVDGGYAEYFVVPEKFAYSIPDVFEDEEASPLLCAGIIGFRALRLSEIKPHQRLALIGFGASAHVAIQVALHWGCEVYVYSRSKEHREHAENLGASWTGTADQDPPCKVDSVVNFTPAGETVLDGMRILDKGGTQACAGIYMTPIPEMDYNKYLYHERTLRSVANATRLDGEELLRTAAEIPIKTTTTPFPLKDANKALKMVKHSELDGAAVLRISE